MALRRRVRGFRRTRIVVAFSKPMNPGRAQDLGNYRLAAPGPDGRFETADDRSVRVQSARYDPPTRSVTLVTQRRIPRGLRLQLRVDGLGTAGVADAFGQILDGDRDGRAGGTFTAVLAGIGSPRRGLPAGPTPEGR